MWNGGYSYHKGGEDVFGEFGRLEGQMPERCVKWKARLRGE